MGCPEHRSGMPCSSSTVISHMEQPSSRKRSKKGKKGPFGPQKTLLGAPEVLGGQRVARRGQYQVKVCGEHESNPGGPIRGSWDQIWSPGALPEHCSGMPCSALLYPIWNNPARENDKKRQKGPVWPPKDPFGGP